MHWKGRKTIAERKKRDSREDEGQWRKNRGIEKREREE